MQNRHNNEFKIEEVDFSSIPFEVDLEDIQLNGKLLTDEKIEALREALQSCRDDRYSKQADAIRHLNLPYGIIKEEEKYFAIYKGVRHEKELGQGAFGKVKLAQNLEAGEWIAPKVMKEERTEDAIRRRAIREKSKRLAAQSAGVVTISKEEEREYRKLKHRRDSLRELIGSETFILKRLNLLAASPISRYKPTIPIKHTIPMKYIPGCNLLNFLKLQEEFVLPYPDFRWCDIAIQMAEAVQKVHQQGLLHCDIKPANFVYDPETFKVGLVDYGFTKLAGEDLVYQNNRWEGTEDYLAPEVEVNFQFNEKTEVFALGQSIREVFGIPVREPNGCEREPLHITQEISGDEGVIRFLNRMTSNFPNSRPGLPEVIRFLKDCRENIPASSLVGIIDIGEYVKKSKQEKKWFVRALKCVNEVVFIAEAREENRFDYLRAIRELEDRYIYGKKKVFITPDKHDFMANLRDLFASREIFYDFYYFSTDPKAICEGTQAAFVQLTEDKLHPEDYFSVMEESLEARSVPAEVEENKSISPPSDQKERESPRFGF